MKGLYLPIVTPFKNGEVDYKSLKKLVNHYINEGVNGIIPLGTTGESPTVSEDEYMKILHTVIECVQDRVPVIAGAGGNNTKEVIKKFEKLNKLNIQGILSVCPYYNNPDQRGIYEHFKIISQFTDKGIILYNIPYRTGRNIENETVFKLAEINNIIGIKDASGNFNQTQRLILDAPKDFSVLTGEDINYYSSLTLGASGGILASSHINTKKFIDIYKLINNNNHKEALRIWEEINKIIPLLFKETNPAPIKYILKENNLIECDEVRLPLVNISESLKTEINVHLISDN